MTTNFTGKERDAESGLEYFGARYYGSALRRFTNPDWSAKPQAVPYADLSNPQTLNLYVYVQNNPLGRADVDGHADYYTPNGHHLGGDGDPNGTVVITTNQHPLRLSDGTVVSASAYDGKVYSFSREEGNAIRASVDRTLAPAGGDRKGGFHEEGFTEDAKGIHVAAPGPAYQLGDATAHINQTINDSTTMIEHTHPAGTPQAGGGIAFGATEFKSEAVVRAGSGAGLLWGPGITGVRWEDSRLRIGVPRLRQFLMRIQPIHKLLTYTPTSEIIRSGEPISTVTIMLALMTITDDPRFLQCRWVISLVLAAVIRDRLRTRTALT